MSKRVAHLINLTVPALGFVSAVVVLWDRAVDARQLAVLAGFYLACGLGITVGFHRHFTHRSFATHRPVAWALAALGSMALQGSLADWVADHRKHHALADREGDPHSPHGSGSTLRGLWHAHLGWLFDAQGRAEKERYAPEVLEDPVLRAIDRGFPVLVALSLALPFALGYGLTGTLAGAAEALLWGGLVRIFLFHHATFCVNSLGHFAGSRRFATADRSTNVAWLAPMSLGETWHNNHHAFPRSAFHGMRWWELDVAGLAIRLMESAGLAWNVVRIAPERRREKLLAPAPRLR